MGTVGLCLSSRRTSGRFPQELVHDSGASSARAMGAKSPDSRRLTRIENRQWNEQRHSEPFGSEAENPRAGRALASITMGDDEHRKVDGNDYACSKT
jgi:hypothetical protein